jgi:aminopeptidase YwaD
MNRLRDTLEQIWQVYSGEAAWQTVSDLGRFHRIQASPGFRQAAHLVYQRLVRDGLAAELLSYPANERASFWAWPSFREWECTEASLHLVEPEEQAELLADYRSCPLSLIQRSVSFEGRAEVVLLEDGDQDADYEDLDVTGKVVLSRGDLRRVWELAVARRGAVGILFDGMRSVNPVRPEGDLADIRQYTSFWWQPGDVPCFGFVLTPRQGKSLRRLLKKAESPVWVHAQVDSRLYDGAFEVVSAAIPGEIEQEIIVAAHLCHPQPSANDNASGAAAALEAARTLQWLIDNGVLARPRRTIRFLWMAEMTGMAAYLSRRETDSSGSIPSGQGLDCLVAGINLDMVGEDQSQTGSSWLIELPPEAATSFAPDLLIRLRAELQVLKGMTDVSPSHTGIGAVPLYRQAEMPFSGGSDHYILSDPTVGVPTPMLIQWPDRFYHTSADTPDRTDPQSLARAGTLAAAYAYWLATAGVEEATWLGYEMAARFKSLLTHASQSAVTDAWALSDAQELAMVKAGLDRQLAYLLGRHQAALATLERLAPVQCLIADLFHEAEQAAAHELSWADGAVDLHAAALNLTPSPDIPPRTLSGEEQRAATMMPVRQIRGPIPLGNHLGRLDAADREAWHAAIKARKDGAHYTLTALALYWADGARSLLEIADLIELETGQRDVELLLTYFKLLEKLEFISF